MKRFFLLTLFALTLMACGEGRVGLITDDVVTDAAGCYESVEVSDDAYLVSLDKNCVDLALSDFVIESPPVEQGTLPAVRDWALVATLERDVRQRYWHEFHVQEGTDQPILQAYAAGKDFLFVIENSRDNKFFHSVSPIQFYFHQPEPPADAESEIARTVLYYPSPPSWYEHWGPETNIAGKIDRSRSGFVMDIDLGTPGWKFTHADNRAKAWVGGSVKFGATRDGIGWHSTYAPHIKTDYVLKIYVR